MKQNMHAKNVILTGESTTSKYFGRGQALIVGGPVSITLEFNKIYDGSSDSGIEEACQIVTEEGWNMAAFDDMIASRLGHVGLPDAYEAMLHASHAVDWDDDDVVIALKKRGYDGYVTGAFGQVVAVKWEN